MPSSAHAVAVPGDRIYEILRTLLDSPEKSPRFLRALPGGLDQFVLVGWAEDAGEGDGAAPCGVGGDGGETLLDDLVRTASRDPARLEARPRPRWSTRCSATTRRF